MSGVAPEVLLYSLLLGAGLGVLFTVFETLRIVLSMGKIITFLSDILFCVVCAAASFVLALSVSGGSMRFYQLGCEVLGFACVYLTATWLVYRFLPRAMRSMRKIMGKPRSGAEAVDEKMLRKKPERRADRSKKCVFFRIPSKKNEKKT